MHMRQGDPNRAHQSSFGQFAAAVDPLPDLVEKVRLGVLKLASPVFQFEIGLRETKKTGTTRSHANDRCRNELNVYN